MSSVLCIDIGGTRIGAAVFPKFLSAETLQTQPLFAMRTLGWLNPTLPELLSADNRASVVRQIRFEDDFDDFAIGVPGPVRGGRFFRSDLDVPADLKHQFSRFTDKNITLVKDADAWMAGATAYSELANEVMQFPAVALILGTGVGVSMTSDGRRFDSLAISEWPPEFKSLAGASAVAIEESWQVHDIFGNRFFEWVAAEKKQWSYSRTREEFSRRVVPLMDDIFALLGLKKGAIKTVFVGGGNSEYVSRGLLHSQTGCEVQSFSSSTLRMDPDLVPLIGLHKIAFGCDVGVEM